MADISYRFRLRRGLAASWLSLNSVLLGSEFGHEIDTGYLKLGDGSTAWNDLKYIDAAIQIGRLQDVDITDRADGKALIWNAAAQKHVYGTSGSNYTAGTGIAIDSTDPDNPIINSNVPIIGSGNAGVGVSIDVTNPSVPIISSVNAGIALKGTVTTYAGLPSSGNSNGDAYYNYADSLVYVYQGSFPASASGIPVNSINDQKLGMLWNKDIATCTYVVSSNQGTSFIQSEFVGYIDSGSAGSMNAYAPSTGPLGLNLSTGANAAGYCRLWWMGGPKLNLRAGALQIDGYAIIPSASTSTQRYAFAFALTDVISGTFVQRVNFTYSDNVNSGNWQATWFAAGALVTTINGSAAPPFNTPFKFTIKVNSAGTSATFYINDILIVTITIAPTIFLGFAMSIGKSVGTTAVTSQLLAVKLKQTYNTPL